MVENRRRTRKLTRWFAVGAIGGTSDASKNDRDRELDQGRLQKEPHREDSVVRSQAGAPFIRGRQHRMCQERIPVERPDAASQTKSVEIVVFEMNFSRRRTNSEGEQETHQARAIVSPHEISLGGCQL